VLYEWLSVIGVFAVVLIVIRVFRHPESEPHNDKSGVGLVDGSATPAIKHQHAKQHSPSYPRTVDDLLRPELDGYSTSALIAELANRGVFQQVPELPLFPAIEERATRHDTERRVS
jgi:hypothetical protein